MSERATPRLVGVIHLPPLPGSPRAVYALPRVIEQTIQDARALAIAGFDLAMIENYGDTPFFRGSVPPVTVSAMTACAAAVRAEFSKLAIGVNVLRNDAVAALSIAKVIEAACVRINVHIGARVTDQGVIEGNAAETLRLRAALGANSVRIWADVDVKHSAALAPRPLEEEAIELVERGMAEALLVTGSGTGVSVDRKHLEHVRDAVPDTPVLIASGANLKDLPELSKLADGVIVGSALRADGRPGGPIDSERAKRFADAFRKAF